MAKKTKKKLEEEAKELLFNWSSLTSGLIETELAVLEKALEIEVTNKARSSFIDRLIGRVNTIKSRNQRLEAFKTALENTED